MCFHTSTVVYMQIHRNLKNINMRAFTLARQYTCKYIYICAFTQAQHYTCIYRNICAFTIAE